MIRRIGDTEEGTGRTVEDGKQMSSGRGDRQEEESKIAVQLCPLHLHSFIMAVVVVCQSSTSSLPLSPSLSVPPVQKNHNLNNLCSFFFFFFHQNASADRKH